MVGCLSKLGCAKRIDFLRCVVLLVLNHLHNFIICNRLPVSKLVLPYDSPPLFSAAIVPQFSCNGTSSSASPTPFCHLFHVYIPLHFYRFRIKSLKQFLTLQKLTIPVILELGYGSEPWTNDDGTDALKSRWVTSYVYTRTPRQRRNRCETGARHTPDGRPDDDV